jgi:hypothetical protein
MPYSCNFQPGGKCFNLACSDACQLAVKEQRPQEEAQKQRLQQCPNCSGWVVSLEKGICITCVRKQNELKK